MKISVWVSVLVIMSCESLSTTASEENGPYKKIQKEFKIIGSAHGIDKGYTVSGHFIFIVRLDIDPNETLSSSIKYSGVAGGEAYRSVVDKNGDGIGLLPNMYFQDFEIEVFDHTITIFLDSASQNLDAPFYRYLSILEGRRSSDSPAFGEWICAPFNLNQGGWVDTVGTVTGEWKIDVENSGGSEDVLSLFGKEHKINGVSVRKIDNN